MSAPYTVLQCPNGSLYGLAEWAVRLYSDHGYPHLDADPEEIAEGDAGSSLPKADWPRFRADVRLFRRVCALGGWDADEVFAVCQRAVDERRWCGLLRPANTPDYALRAQWAVAVIVGSLLP